MPRTVRWVFPTVSNKRHAHVYKIVERVAASANVAGTHPHKFRATFLTRLLQSGCDIANVMALASHRNIRTSQRYLGFYQTGRFSAGTSAPGSYTAITSPILVMIAPGCAASGKAR